MSSVCIRTLPKLLCVFSFFFQAEDGIRDVAVTGVQTCALPICGDRGRRRVLAAAGSRRAPTVAAGGGCGGAVRRGVHRDRPGRRLHPHGRRAGQHDARVTHSGVPAWHPGCRLRTGCGDRRVPAPLPDRGRHRDAPPSPPHGSGRGAMKRVALYAAALGFVVFAGFPFYWMLVTSFKQNRDLYVGASDLSHIPWIFNDPPTLEHVKLLFGQTDFLRWVLNTLLVVAAVVVITVAGGGPAGGSPGRRARPRGGGP